MSTHAPVGWKKGNGRFANSISSLLNPTQQIGSRRYALQLRFSSHSRCVSEPLLSLRSLCLFVQWELFRKE